jgi:DNA-binding NarL/FixJ family response regulator
VSGTTAIVIDGHRSWLDLAESVLSAASVEVVGTAMSLREGTRLLEERRPGLAVVETAMEESGADALSWLSATAVRFPDVTLIAVSESQDMDAIRGALTAGAAAVVLKSDDGMDLAAAVRQTDERSFFLRSEAQPAAPVENGHTAEHGLTKREVEILRLAARGLSNGEIAKQLWVTEQTVKFHLANTYRKLGVSNRTGAARQAQLLGLLTEE